MTNPSHLFVSIRLCGLLQELGLSPDTWAKYRQYSPTEVLIVAPGFDHEGLYQDLGEIEGVRASYVDTPAYTIMDMLQCIPDYCICIEQLQFLVSSFKGYNLPTTSDKRLPDAAAKMVERIIRDRVIPVDTLNASLSPNTIV